MMEKFVTAKGKKRNVFKADRSHLPTCISAKVEFTSYEIQNKLNFMKIPGCFSAVLAIYR